jgi:hypothetical protein
MMPLRLLRRRLHSKRNTNKQAAAKTAPIAIKMLFFFTLGTLEIVSMEGLPIEVLSVWTLLWGANDTGETPMRA